MDAVLAEVAARYGVAVADGARVQVVPRGMSGVPVLPMGKGLSWRDGAEAKKRIVARQRAFERAAVREVKAATAPVVKADHPMIAAQKAQHLQRMDMLRRLVADGARPAACDGAGV